MIDGYIRAMRDIRRSQNTAHAVNNMSLGPRHREPVSYAVALTTRVAHGLGMTTVTSAGNEHRAASGSRKSITVGATDRNKRRLQLSNFGPRVDIFAPGESIISAYIGPRNMETGTGTGTSAAAP
ncbi:subtilisin-like protein [Myriangium duriaei CBS 260.36]|uniref:Subtilisin-like protein n=1 Tax=Myriangium duriaei CBS 260.36 TaxID=1168546 RepID=A0A9P4IQZ7_9PEZI|nr:subtilisin-like protein [Myriangium duriaei CBS 260.36]